MGAGKVPKPSAQENALKQQQADLLKQQGDMMQESIRRQDLLAPLMYKQAGLEPIYEGQRGSEAITADALRGRGYSFIQDASGKITQASDGAGNMLDLSSGMLPAVGGNGNIVGFREGPPTPEQLAARREAELMEKQYKLQELMFPHQLEAMGYQASYDPQGQLSGISKAPLSEADQYRQSAELAFLKRQDAALKGELPVAPGLMRDLDAQKAHLDEKLRKQLGTGYETSSPGIQALGEYMGRRNDSLESARRGDLGQAGAFAQASNDRIFGARDNAFNAASILGTPTLQSMSALAPLAAGGRSAANMATMMGLVGGQGGQGGGSGGTLGDLANQLGTLSGQLGATRMNQAQMENQARQQRRQQASMIGSTAGAVLGGVVGAIPTFGIGAPAGAAIGGALGGGIGYGLG